MRIYYTNANNLLSKNDELRILVSMKMTDIIIVTEVFPKSIQATNIDVREYSLTSYQCFSDRVQDNSRGEVIYVKESIATDYCKLL